MNLIKILRALEAAQEALCEVGGHQAVETLEMIDAAINILHTEDLSSRESQGTEVTQTMHDLARTNLSDAAMKEHETEVKSLSKHYEKMFDDPRLLHEAEVASLRAEVERLQALHLERTKSTETFINFERERVGKLVEALEIADNYLFTNKEWTFSEYERVRALVNKALKEYKGNNK